ncbi:DedA family protein [Aeromicrobium fastidiosum]|uniref:DedA family protein n=1 Tax=Aeromicrobium fastidiosum TaxID=52699 RepID=UPI001E048BC9|nr:DedA family protein [Aeromicrobium fastidiosum]MBP2390864.1 membrane protein DedA with SNARE-associated domain [Aeromicrobium fastidiosum]
MIDGISDFVLGLAGSPWVYLVVLAFAAVDAFFPPIPSESAIVALAAFSASSGQPDLVLLGLAAVGGALIGDHAAYGVGRWLGTDRFAILRRPAAVELIERAEAELDKRAASLILTARFIPVGRVAVNVTAGATRFRYHRFAPLAVMAATAWATYCVLVGLLAGSWVKDQPLLGAAGAIVFALLAGIVIDKLLARHRKRAANAS